MIISYCIIAWLAIGSAFVDKSPVQYLPTSTDGCANDTFSQHIAAGHLLNVMHSRSPNPFFNESTADEYAEAPAVGDDLELEVVPAKTE